MKKKNSIKHATCFGQNPKLKGSISPSNFDELGYGSNDNGLAV